MLFTHLNHTFLLFSFSNAPLPSPLLTSPHLISPLCSLREEKQYLEKEIEIQPIPAVSSSLQHSGVALETWITSATVVFRGDKYEFYFKPPSRLNPSICRLAPIQTKGLFRVLTLVSFKQVKLVMAFGNTT